MTWNKTWNDILNGGPTRWKIDDIEAKKIALTHITDYASTTQPLSILCPLAGDDLFVYYAWKQGHELTAIDIVPAALKIMRSYFDDDYEEGWTTSNSKSGKVFTHSSGRATLYEGDMFEKRPKLHAKFDVIYDKDSFGAINLNMRRVYCEILSESLKLNGIIYIEVKNKETDRDSGPPYHVEKEELMDCFGDEFQYVQSLGEVYPLNWGVYRQMGHILKKIKERK